ncbi:hypothetical protein RR49_01179 [Microbacterium ginsengisoli]|uniref:Uncharacterized protein n=1 Tax=Microbacterium ginsengisoli TaxID=400772 RepID=A0A0F0LUU1_9MICO|nr:hypothetical protein [Microbacterium ginsengisoli]KJL37067.1 hypothetical protein RR49_01179 [Microbacterium ginsengisoli]
MTTLQVESDPVVCTVCETAVARFNDQGLASKLTIHGMECAGHGFTGCAHDGPCYRRVTDHENGSKS